MEARRKRKRKGQVGAKRTYSLPDLFSLLLAQAGQLLLRAALFLLPFPFPLEAGLFTSLLRCRRAEGLAGPVGEFAESGGSIWCARRERRVLCCHRGREVIVVTCGLF